MTDQRTDRPTSELIKPHCTESSLHAPALLLLGDVDNYKNLAIANRSRVSCINTNNNTMTLKSGLEVTQGHWKWYYFKIGGHNPPRSKPPLHWQDRTKPPLGQNPQVKTPLVRQNRATRDFGLAGLSRCALRSNSQILGPSENCCDSVISIIRLLL